ncbi:hypothetical protein CFIO01_12801 [Colletotrichum fioriniae PJ7]|uniref:Uncharacterized protein n=1 Tax=Colletotrichum fioriniae PJ7 TaxID=1445577 RepID=A0A010S8W7_9PEZI|nr:hypothetical protein CFIO01_12801 [Colletotrichum fioriniae PJ7]
MASFADLQKDHGQSHHESENEDGRGLCEECEIEQAEAWRQREKAFALDAFGKYEECRVALCTSNFRILGSNPYHHGSRASQLFQGPRNLALPFLPELLGPEEHPPLRSQPAINPPSQLGNFISPLDRLPININK